MKVYLTGATGFVGRYVLQALRAAGHEVRCLVRQPDHPLPFEEEGVEKVGGDLLRPETFAGTLDGCEAVVHLVGIIAERPRQAFRSMPCIAGARCIWWRRLSRPAFRASST